MERAAYTSALSVWGQVEERNFAAAVNEPHAQDFMIFDCDRAKVIFVRKPRQEMPRCLVLEPLRQGVYITTVIDGTQLGDRPTHYIDRGIGVSCLRCTYGDHSAESFAFYSEFDLLLLPRLRRALNRVEHAMPPNR